MKAQVIASAGVQVGGGGVGRLWSGYRGSRVNESAVQAELL